MSKTMKWSGILQAAILGKLVDCMVEEGFRVEICDQDGGGMFVYGVPDAGQKPKTGFDYWARLQPANNGSDFISDFTTNLEFTIKPALEFAAQFDD